MLTCNALKNALANIPRRLLKNKIGSMIELSEFGLEEPQKMDFIAKEGSRNHSGDDYAQTPLQTEVTIRYRIVISFDPGLDWQTAEMQINPALVFNIGNDITYAGTISGSAFVLPDISPVFVDGGTHALGREFELIQSLFVSGTGTVAFDAASATNYELSIFGPITSLTGTFTSLDLPLGITWDTSHIYTDGMVFVIAVPELFALPLFPGCGTAFLARRRRARRQ